MARSRREREEEESYFAGGQLWVNLEHNGIRYKLYNPKVDSLKQKLRDMPMLQDRDVRLHITEDQIWLFKADPIALARIITQAMGWWQIASGINEHDHVKSFLPKTENPVISDLKEDEVQKSKIDPSLKRPVREAIAIHTYEPGKTDSGVETPMCRCGRHFDLFEEWSNHLRSVIWRILEQES